MTRPSGVCPNTGTPCYTMDDIAEIEVAIAIKQAEIAAYEASINQTMQLKTTAEGELTILEQELMDANGDMNCENCGAI